MSAFVRTAHRWLSIVFTATVAANFVAMAFGPPPPWIVYAPLPFLFAMMATGLFMFFRPYVTRARPAS
jgi:hypothetical protein